MTCTVKLLPIVFACGLLFTACQSNHNSSQKTETKDSVAVTNVTYPKVKLADVDHSPEYPNAQLSLKSANAQVTATDSAMIVFNFNVKNYELKMQTPDSGGMVCNNSVKGQHIHFILDNKPYVALYAPVDTITLAKNSEHYLMAFLSRSYHESLKNNGTSLLYHFKIDEKGKMQKMKADKTPMIFYSRPKGDYFGKDTANVLLDFYVWNGTLSPDGYKVKAQISNDNHKANDTTITITKWKSHFIQNLGTGKCHITLTLIDKDGKSVEGPNTTAARDFQLATQEPMKK